MTKSDIQIVKQDGKGVHLKGGKFMPWKEYKELPDGKVKLSTTEK